MKKLKRLLDKAVMPISFMCSVLSFMYTEPSKSDQILLVIFAGAFWAIDIIISKNDKDKN